jgi:starvation-inducible DNA-binding protein
MFALYVKTKNFHWHVTGPHFRDYHLLFDEQATQIFATTDAIAERVRKLGKPTLCSIGRIFSASSTIRPEIEFRSYGRAGDGWDEGIETVCQTRKRDKA